MHHPLPLAAVLWIAASCAPGSDAPDASTSLPPTPTHLGRAHRLSGVELSRTAKDVWGVDLPTLSFLPAVTPVLDDEHLDEVAVDLPSWVDAIEAWARQTLAMRRTAVVPPPTAVRWRAPDLDWDHGGPALLSDATFSVLQASAQPMRATFEVPEAGNYDVALTTVLAWRQSEVSVEVYLDGTWWGRATSPPTDLPGRAFVATTGAAELSEGAHELLLEPSFSRASDLTVPAPPAFLEEKGPWFAFDTVDLRLQDAPDPIAPLGPAIVCPAGDAPCTRAALADLGARLWRRPLTATEIDAAMAVIDEGRAAGLSPEDAHDEALVGMMLAPDFAWLPGRGAKTTDEEGRDLRPWIRAARLSYAVWQAPPDAELRGCAEAGGLAPDDPGVCGWAAQRDRLLADPRSDVLVTEMVERWLGVHDVARLDFISRDYPLWSLELVRDLQDELREAIRAARRERAPIATWLQGQIGRATGRVARYYGAPTGSLLEPHDFDRGADRPGILGMGIVALASARGTEPSAVDHAVWVLPRMLCRSLPTPPAVVPPLPLGLDPVTSLAQHAADPACAACHRSLDPYGAPMLGFDAIGAARDVSPGPTALPEGPVIDSLAAYAAFLTAHPDFSSCAARRFAAWVWRRHPTVADEARLLDVERAAIAAGGDLDAWVRAALDADAELAGAAP